MGGAEAAYGAEGDGGGRRDLPDLVILLAEGVVPMVQGRRARAGDLLPRQRQQHRNKAAKLAFTERSKPVPEAHTRSMLHHRAPCLGR